MTTYTFIGKPNTQDVDWNDPTVWQNGAFPNSSTADVRIPEITSGKSIEFFRLTIGSGQSFAANSLSITDNDLVLGGTLSVTNAVDIEGGIIDLTGGTLSAGSLGTTNGVLGGSGQVDVAGNLFSLGVIQNFDQGSLSVSAAAFGNFGTLEARPGGTLTITVGSGGFSNLSGSTLSGGNYIAEADQTGGGVLDLNVGAVITTDAANDIEFINGGDIQCYDSGSSKYVSLQTSLTTIAQHGTLSLNNQTFNSNGLTVDGVLNLYDDFGPNTFNAPQLTIGSQGLVDGVGTIAAPISNSGVIIAGFESFFDAGLLEIKGAASGSGVLEIGGTSTLQLDASDTENVVFSNASNVAGTLILEDLGGFTGAIEPESNGDNIILGNTSYGSVTGFSYAGNSSGGTLTIDKNDTTIITLNFIGDLQTADFTLSAGPTSNIEITVNPAPSPSFPPPNPAAPSGTTAFMVLNDPGNGNYEVYDIGNNSALAAHPLATIGAWQPVGLGNFNGTDSTDLAVRDDAGQFQFYDLANNNVTTSGIMGTVGRNWLPVGTGKFDSSNYTDIMMRQANGAAVTYDAFIVRNNQFAAANPIATVGSDWQTVGFGDVNGDGTQDMVLRNPANGTLEYYDIDNGQLTSAGVLGVLGTGWQPVGFGHFDNSGFSDLIMRNNTGGQDGQYDLFEIRNNQIVGAHEIALLFDRQPAGIADINGDGTDDMVLQNTDTGGFEYYDIVNGQVTAAGDLGVQVGSDWTVTGITPAMGTALSSPGTALASDPAPSSDNASPFMASDPGPSSFMASDPGLSSFMAQDPGPGWITDAWNVAPASPTLLAAPVAANLLHPSV